MQVMRLLSIITLGIKYLISN